jgi:hypothetical protein
MRRFISLLAIGILMGACTNTSASSSALPSTAAPTNDGAGATGDAAPSSTPVGPAEFSDVQGQLHGGTYVLRYGSIGGRANFPTLSFTFTVPDGWEKVGVDGVLWSSNGTRVGFSVPDAVFMDPCVPERGVARQALGPTVSELAFALLDVPGWDSAFVGVTDDFGYGALQLAVTVPDVPACGVDDHRPLLRTPGFPGYVDAGLSGTTVDLWIMSAEGTRVVIYSHTPADASAAVRDELRAVLESVRIDA